MNGIRTMETKILQFGEGNFLRCFIDWMVQRVNDNTDFDGGVQIVQPRGEELNAVSQVLNAQGGHYHTCLRGLRGGRCVEEIEDVTCVKGVDLWTNLATCARLPTLRFVVSNTTEAGIQYLKGANTFPYKVTKLLQIRCAAGLPGFVFIPCELIEDNGNVLKECILQYAADWGDAALCDYISRSCVFCSTLVDRIVSGSPDAKSAERYARMIGVRDETFVCGEPFHFLAIEPPEGFDLEAELPLRQAGVNVVYTRNLQPYRMRKVRFLNAVHTSIVYWGLERGFEEVAEVVSDREGGEFLRKILFEEIYPTVDMPDEEKADYASGILERLANPFTHHRLASIALNTVAKWKVRCLPVVCDYYRIFGKLPPCMMQGYEAMARHYDCAQ